MTHSDVKRSFTGLLAGTKVVEIGSIGPGSASRFRRPEVFTAAVRPREQAPGWTLLRTLMEDGAEPTDSP
ncbi:hypothetical protein [Streptomyces sp. NPDC057199]|uniref:hypothetical protein n=1 Tax=Streptomyces sp. NPDC057199 TaxID=3346047 RepID=UPI00362E65DB